MNENIAGVDRGEDVGVLVVEPHRRKWHPVCIAQRRYIDTG
jgi:hypothetical protein